MLSRRNDCFKQRLFLIFTWVIRFWIVYLVRVPCLDALVYVGTYHYQNFMAFVRSEERCGFYPENVSSFVRRDHSIEKESCLIFMKSEINFSALSKVAKAETNYFAFGAKYSFAIKASPCTNRLQNVEMVLFCEGPTVLNGSTCEQGCNRLSEVCRRSSDVNEELCIPERKIDDFCNGNLPCPRNSECRMMNNFTSCQCLGGYGALDGRCVKVGFTLGEHCYVNGHCTGTSNSVCKAYSDQAGSLTCQCSTGFMRHNKNCLKVGLKLNESCYVDAQCTGSLNSGLCMADSNEIHNPTCRCSTGYIRYKERCLKVYKQLYDECEIDDQCNRTSEEVVCKEKYSRKMCMCNTGYTYLEVNGTWKCIKVGLTLGEPCYIHEQCTGTPPAVSCVSKENDVGVLACQCNSTRGYMRYNETCLQVDKQLYEECEIDVQCNGTSGKEVCTEIRGRKLCLCEVGFIEDKTAMTCFQATMVEEQAWIADKRIQLLVIAVGGFVIITWLVCLFTTVLFALKKKKSDNQRFEYQDSTHIEIGHIHNSPNDDTGNIYDEDVSRAYDHNSVYDHTDGIYNVTHQREEQKDENFYNHIETQSSFSEQHSDHYTYSYNHLHQRPFPMSLVYNEPNTTSV